MREVILTDVIEGLKSLDDNICDVCIADGPYNIGKDFGPSKDNLSTKEYIRWSTDWIDECIRVMKDSATLYIYGFSEILCHLAVNLPFPLEFRWLVWSYDNKTVPSLHFWQRSHESILCCWKSKERIFNRDDVRIPYTDAFLKNAAGKVRKSTRGRYSHSDKETVYQANDKGALPRDVLRVPALAGGAGLSERWFLCKTCDDVFPNRDMEEHAGHKTIHHPTQKPYELTRKLLLAAKPKEGGFALIPFAGSGSECAVAHDLGMQYLGFDNNEDYIKLAKGFLAKR